MFFPDGRRLSVERGDVLIKGSLQSLDKEAVDMTARIEVSLSEGRINGVRERGRESEMLECSINAVVPLVIFEATRCRPFE